MIREILTTLPSTPALRNAPRTPFLASASATIAGSGGSNHSTVSKRNQTQLSQPTESSSSSNNATTTPIPLLPYDDFYISKDQIARTFYQLEKSTSGGKRTSSLAVEEIHDMKTARKKFVLRQERRRSNMFDDDAHLHIKNHGLYNQFDTPALERSVLSSTFLLSFHINEVFDENPVEKVGTGATTWEASIAASLYFSSHPELKGDLVELGCGVGLGGILTTVGPSLTGTLSKSQLKSITLTDHSDEVLRKCEENIQQTINDLPQKESLPFIQTAKLDWYDFLENKAGFHGQQYDTVLACDCVYRKADVKALGSTLDGLLRDDPSSQVHIFSPVNRSALSELIDYMRNDLHMIVTKEYIDMTRCRLKPKNVSEVSWKDTKLDECDFASKSNPQFVHVIASKRGVPDKSGLFDELD